MNVASGFECDFRGYKQQACEFFQRLKMVQTLAPEQIEAGLHALRLAFIYLAGSDNERYQAEIVLILAQRKADEYLPRCLGNGK